MNYYKLILNNIIDKTFQSFDLLRAQGQQEETIFLPVGILLLKWISDSKQRLHFKSNFEYKHLLDDIKIFNSTLINKTLRNIAMHIERQNEELEGIFTKLCFDNVEYIEFHCLQDIISAYKDIDLSDSHSEKYITGPFIDFFLEYISENLNSYSFITTPSIKQLLSRLFNISEKMIIGDITCGTGGILSQIINECNYYEPNIADINLYGQEINFKIALICKINLLLHGVRFPEINVKDTVKEPVLLKNNRRFDLILSNLPLGTSWDETQLICRDELNYDLPNKSNAEWVIIQRGIAALNSSGKAAFIVSKGTLTRTTERKIRSQILYDDIIEAVISLPNNLYGTKTIPVEILIINKNKMNKSKILFIDSSKEYIKKERGKNILAANHISKIIETYRDFDEINEYSKIVSLSDIENNNFELDSSYYINNEFENMKNFKMKRLCDVADIKRGLQVPTNRLIEISEEEPLYYYIKISDLTNNTIEFNTKIKDLSKKELDSFKLQPNDILLSARGVLTKTAIYEEDMPPSVFSGNIMLIRLKKNYNPHFLKFYFESETGKKLLSSIQEGATIVGLNSNKLKNILIPDIEIDIQNELAERIKSNERKYRERMRVAQNIYEENLKIINMEIDSYINEY